MDNNLAQIYQTVSIVAFSLAGASLAFAIFCFFKFRIIKIMNDLSGRTARKSIAKRRAENEKSGDKSFRPSPKAKARGAKTDKIRKNGRSVNKKQAVSNMQVKNADKSEISPETNETELLTDKNETELLSEGTALLTADSVLAPAVHDKLEMIQSIVIIHTNEVI